MKPLKQDQHNLITAKPLLPPGQEGFLRNKEQLMGTGIIVCGLNGAGKSTLQKILLGMLPGYQGSVTVNGTECKQRGPDFYEEIGVDFEFSTRNEKPSEFCESPGARSETAVSGRADRRP